MRWRSEHGEEKEGQEETLKRETLKSANFA